MQNIGNLIWIIRSYDSKILFQQKIWHVILQTGEIAIGINKIPILLLTLLQSFWLIFFSLNQELFRNSLTFSRSKNFRLEYRNSTKVISARTKKSIDLFEKHFYNKIIFHLTYIRIVFCSISFMNSYLILSYCEKIFWRVLFIRKIIVQIETTFVWKIMSLRGTNLRTKNFPRF